jgi:cobalamin biosynthesis Mg chelatase CobN
MKTKPLFLLVFLAILTLSGCAGSKSKSTTSSTVAQTAETVNTETTKQRDSSGTVTTTTVRETGTSTRKGVDTTVTLPAIEGKPAVLVTPDVTVVATRIGDQIQLRAVIPERTETYSRDVEQTNTGTTIRQSETQVESVARSQLNRTDTSTETKTVRHPWWYSWWWLIVLIVLLMIGLWFRYFRR